MSDKKIVLGIVPAGAVETAINNFVEADYDENDISLIMADRRTARAIQDDTGPLKGTLAATLERKLVPLGVSRSDASEFARMVDQGNALLAVAVDGGTVDTTKEMFSDYRPAKIAVVGG